MSGVPGIAYNPFIDEEARDAYFDIEQAVDLPSVERVEKTETLTFEQSRQGVFLEERVVEPLFPKLKRQLSFEYGSRDNPLKTSLITM